MAVPWLCDRFLLVLKSKIECNNVLCITFANDEKCRQDDTCLTLLILNISLCIIRYQFKKIELCMAELILFLEMDSSLKEKQSSYTFEDYIKFKYLIGMDIVVITFVSFS